MGENIQFYDLTNKMTPQLIKEYNFSAPKVKMDGEGSVIYQKENLDSVLLNLTLAMPIEYTKNEGKIYIKPIKK